MKPSLNRFPSHCLLSVEDQKESRSPVAVSPQPLGLPSYLTHITPFLSPPAFQFVGLPIAQPSVHRPSLPFSLFRSPSPSLPKSISFQQPARELASRHPSLLHRITGSLSPSQNPAAFPVADQNQQRRRINEGPWPRHRPLPQSRSLDLSLLSLSPRSRFKTETRRVKMMRPLFPIFLKYT